MQAYWYFDFVSPFSYLQLSRVLAWRKRFEITPVPIVFGALLKHQGNLGPAEIAGKRAFTYRFARWQAEQSGLRLRFPPAHPFNPLPALRLCIAVETSWESVEAIFDHLWFEGRSGAQPGELADLARTFGIGDVATAINAAHVKERLRANTDAAIAAGIFGVPTLRFGDDVFWGNDATAMVEDWLAHPDRFASEEYRRLADLPFGLERRL
jgi:2-hydroxychromene-2-carboxylate isomerase